MRINGHEVDILALRQQFTKEYKFLYDHADAYVTGEDEAMAFGDELIEKRPDLVKAFCDGRTVFVVDGKRCPIFDPLSSDREVAAFGFAVNELYG